MHLRIGVVAIGVGLLAVSAGSQQSHWASADDKTAKYIIESERKWAEGVCGNNGVVAGLLAEDFQGTSTTGARYTKADELRDEKEPHLRLIQPAIPSRVWKRTRGGQRQDAAEREGVPGVDRYVVEAWRKVADRRSAG